MSPSVDFQEKVEPLRAREERRALMERITNFILEHDLAITGQNLATVAAGLAGTDPEISRAFVARDIAKNPITQAWLDKIGKAPADPRAIEGLMDTMERSLDNFARTAKTAQDQTNEQRGAIDAQIERMVRCESGSDSSSEVDRLVDLSKAMLARMVNVERAMQRSRDESDRLRKHLAEARCEADLDHLTRLPNRRAFDRELSRAAELAKLGEAPVSIALCDVDHFKAINDVHGHEAGDRVLIAIARSFNRRATDDYFAARHGGEEFALIFPGMTQEAAWRILDAIRRDQSARRMINRETGRPFGKVSFSGGVTQLKPGEDGKDALARADRALYEAKEAGRDQIAAI
jgi:diguanylate cyclase